MMTKCGKLQAHTSRAGPIYSGQFKRGTKICLEGADVEFTLITLSWLVPCNLPSILSHLFGNCSYPWILRIFPYRAYSCCLCFCFCSCFLLPRCLSQNPDSESHSCTVKVKFKVIYSSISDTPLPLQQSVLWELDL